MFRRTVIQYVAALALVWMLPFSYQCATVAAAEARELVPLSSLDLSKIQQGWGKARANQSVTEKPLAIAGERFASGVGTHARSVIIVELAGGSTRFRAACGVDDNAGRGKGSVQFRVLADGKRLWSSPVMHCGEKAQRADLDVHGVKTLILIASDAGDGVHFDHADWADAQFEVAGPRPRLIGAPAEPPVILTPPALQQQQVRHLVE